MSRIARDAQYAGEMLGFAKASVRNTALAITETATSAVREMLTKQLNHAISLHAQIFHYMLARSLYPAYSTESIIRTDFENAEKALHAPIQGSLDRPV